MFRTGMTKVKVGKEDNSSAEFVERRRAALERYRMGFPLEVSCISKTVMGSSRLGTVIV